MPGSALQTELFCIHCLTESPPMTLKHRHTQTILDRASRVKIGYLAPVKDIINLKGYQTRIGLFKVTVFLLNGWVLAYWWRCIIASRELANMKSSFQVCSLHKFCSISLCHKVHIVCRSSIWSQIFTNWELAEFTKSQETSLFIPSTNPSPLYPIV